MADAKPVFYLKLKQVEKRLVKLSYKNNNENGILLLFI
jgi:hypothetical protein